MSKNRRQVRKAIARRRQIQRFTHNLKSRADSAKWRSPFANASTASVQARHAFAVFRKLQC